MFSIIALTVIAVIAFILFRRFGQKLLKAVFYCALNLLFIEIIVFGYFLSLVYSGNCLLLMGNQKGLDALIKVRLSYSLYFVKGKRTYMNHLDDDLGHSLGKSKEVGKYRTNAQGIRAVREYKLIPDNDTLRVATFGDSHVFGDNVTNEETWQQLLESGVGNIEVMNFGVETYGFGQSYLRYLKDALAFNPDIIYFEDVETGARDILDPKGIFNLKNFRFPYFYKVNFWINDGALLSRSITPYDYFDPVFRKKFIFDPLGIDMKSGFLSSKIFSVTNTGLLIKTLAVRALYRNNLEQFQARKPDQEIAKIILKNLLEVAHKNGTKVLFFSRTESEKLPAYFSSLLEEYEEDVVFADRSQVLNEFCKKRDIVYDELLDQTNHSTPEGHKIFSQAVLDVLKSRDWKGHGKIMRFNERQNRFVNMASPE